MINRKITDGFNRKDDFENWQPLTWGKSLVERQKRDEIPNEKRKSGQAEGLYDQYIGMLHESDEPVERLNENGILPFDEYDSLSYVPFKELPSPLQFEVWYVTVYLIGSRQPKYISSIKFTRGADATIKLCDNKDDALPFIGAYSLSIAQRALGIRDRIDVAHVDQEFDTRILSVDDIQNDGYAKIGWPDEEV